MTPDHDPVSGWTVMLVVLCLLVAFLFCGCGTILRSVMKNDNFQVYPAIVFDAKLIGYAVIGEDKLGLYDEGEGIVSQVMWNSTEVVCGLLDLPISLVTDTVCFPYDLWTIDN
jgi:uncharacterized protein YceK